MSPWVGWGRRGERVDKKIGYKLEIGKGGYTKKGEWKKKKRVRNRKGKTVILKSQVKLTSGKRFQGKRGRQRGGV